MPGIGPRPRPIRPEATARAAQPAPAPEPDLDGQTAGQRLLATFNAALAAASAEQGVTLAWSAHEQQRISAAVELADRAERIDAMIEAELAAAEPKPSTVAKLSAESRLLKRAVADHLSWVKIGPGAAKSERHQRAVAARWDRHHQRRAAGDG